MLKFASGQLSKSDRTGSIRTGVSDGLCVVTITYPAVWTCKFEKIISGTYSIVGLNDFFIQ